MFKQLPNILSFSAVRVSAMRQRRSSYFGSSRHKAWSKTSSFVFTLL